MNMYLVDSPIGLFLIDDQLEIVEKHLYPKAPVKAAEEAFKLQGGSPSREVKKFIKKLGETSIIVDNRDLEAALATVLGKRVEFKKPCQTIQSFREQLPDYLTKEGLFRDAKEWGEFEREFAVNTAKAALAEKAADRDLGVIQAVRAVDDIDKTLNLFSGRMREWYGLHFPELDRLIESHEKYARFIVDIGERGSLTMKKVKAAGFKEDKAKSIVERSKSSSGAETLQEDLAVLQEFCQRLLEMHAHRDRLDKYIDISMEKVAPNLSSVIGATISARLLSSAGGLENLAKMPASTVQVLGAEKALFRSMKTGSRPPKHGVIFQYASIHQSPKWQRGKIARALAGKLAIAARIDAFAGEYKGEDLKKQLEKRIHEINSKYPKPPVQKGIRRDHRTRRRR